MDSRELLKQLYIGIGVTVAVFMVIGAFFIRPVWLYETALLVGGLASCFMLYHTYDCLDRALDMQSKHARQFITVRVLLRLFFRTGLLIAGILIHWSAFVGVTIGLLATKISAYLSPAVRRAAAGGQMLPENAADGQVLPEGTAEAAKDSDGISDESDCLRIDGVEDTLDIENQK